MGTVHLIQAAHNSTDEPTQGGGRGFGRLTGRRLACAQCGDAAVHDLLSLPVDPVTGDAVSVEALCPNTECGALV
jgi:hypothetical protein